MRLGVIVITEIEVLKNLDIYSLKAKKEDQKIIHNHAMIYKIIINHQLMVLIKFKIH